MAAWAAKPYPSVRIVAVSTVRPRICILSARDVGASLQRVRRSDWGKGCMGLGVDAFRTGDRGHNETSSDDHAAMWSGDARGRNRTCKGLPPRDFKSLAFTNFATRATYGMSNDQCRMSNDQLDALGMRPC